MTGLLRRGEESGGYDRRRVQIITIIIFPGNMAAERGWPPGIRVGGKAKGRARERERERDRVEGGRQPGAGREGYHNITNHRRRDVSIQPLTLVRIRALLALISTTTHPPIISSSPFTSIFLAEIRVHDT